MSTWLPGTCGLPSAWRSRVRTIWMRTKAVNISTAAGASEISANDSDRLHVLEDLRRD